MIGPNGNGFVELADAQYEVLIGMAQAIADEYVLRAREIYKRTGVKSARVVISIKQVSKNAKSIHWCKLTTLKDSHQTVTLAIPKGNGTYKYSPSSFYFLEGAYKKLVLDTEEKLAEIRRFASENRKLRKRLEGYDARFTEYLSMRSR